MSWLTSMNLTSSGVVATLCAIGAAFCLYLLVRSTRRRVLLSLAGAVGGALIGLALLWWFVDVQNIFEVDLSFTTRAWSIGAFAGVGLAVTNLFASRWWRKIVAIIAIPVLLFVAAVGVNNDFGAYRTISEVFGAHISGNAVKLAHGEHGEVSHGFVDVAASWDPPADMPAHGKIGTATIRGAESGFKARTALVWLPPAALTDAPPVLPVLLVLSGQPGEPAASFSSGRIDKALDAYAARHRGLAPIVVAADQLAAADVNPMCVDSAAFGNSASYLTVDVPNWVRAHFRVSDDPRMWGVSGFSQGGTCTTQLVTGFPELFGSGIATGSQLGPSLGSREETIAQGFGGSAAAYDAAQPLAIMRAHAPYSDTMLVFGTGELDVKYTGYAHELHTAALAAGIHSELYIEPRGHDWHTVRSVFEKAFPAMAARMGLE